MALILYTALPRQGKSYHVHMHEVVPRIRKGIRVITNIAGYDDPEIKAAIAVYFKIPIKRVNECLIHVESEFFADPNNYPCDETGKLVEGTFIQHGDVLVIDEVYLIWNKDARKPIDPRVMAFFRLHGKFVHPTLKITSQVIFISQGIGDFQPSLSRACEADFNVRKRAYMGFSKHYKVKKSYLIDGRRSATLPAQNFKRTDIGQKTYKSMFAADGESDPDAKPWYKNGIILGLLAAIIMFGGAMTWLIFFSVTGVGGDEPVLAGAQPVIEKASKTPANASHSVDKDGFAVGLPSVNVDASAPSMGPNEEWAQARAWWSRGPSIYCWYGAPIQGGLCPATVLKSADDKTYWRLEDLASLDLEISSSSCSLSIKGGGMDRTWKRSDCPQPTATVF